MGQANIKPTTSRREKKDINPYYQTYGIEGEVDYAVDYNRDYQPSDYDEMYDTSRDNSRKVRHLRYN